MSENSTPEQRTEMPTPKRMNHLRKEGAIHMSHDLASVITMISAFFMLKALWGWLYEDMRKVITMCFRAIANVGEGFDPVQVRNGFVSILIVMGPPLFVLFAAVASVAVLAVMLQTDWNMKERKIKFKWNIIDPIQGFKKIFSLPGLIHTLKSIAKLGLILPVAYSGLKAFAPQMIYLIHTSIPDIMGFTGVALWALFWKIVYILVPLAIFDYFYGKYQWLKINKMTKEEVKDEKKSVEGDEETRRKIMWKGIQRVMQRIKQGVKQADVVITNPTHFAVALKYERGTMRAPIVVAKGMDFMALRIRELAAEAKIPVVERRELARALYASVEVNAEIPYDLFKAVAEVLAYVYKLKNPFWRPKTGESRA